MGEDSSILRPIPGVDQPAMTGHVARSKLVCWVEWSGPMGPPHTLLASEAADQRDRGNAELGVTDAARYIDQGVMI